MRLIDADALKEELIKKNNEACTLMRKRGKIRDYFMVSIFAERAETYKDCLMQIDVQPTMILKGAKNEH